MIENRCARAYVPAPGHARNCHLEKGHDGSHETTFELQAVRWPNVVAK